MRTDSPKEGAHAASTGESRTVLAAPPALDDLLAQDHPARFFATFVDGLDRASWAEMEIGVEGDPLGAPAYHPHLLLSVWLYGFMTGIRSSRKLEAACRDQISFLWLTGWQHPDHNTLWRSTKQTRHAVRHLLKHTALTAVEVGLVALAVQAVDGTKVAANAAGDRTYDATGLERLLAHEAAIRDLEAQNEGGDDLPPPRLPEELHQAQVLRERVPSAMDHLARQGLRRVNLIDEDAQLMKGRQGIMPAYNAQAMVSPLDPTQAWGSGMLITAAEVVTTAAEIRPAGGHSINFSSGQSCREVHCSWEGDHYLVVRQASIQQKVMQENMGC